MIECDEITTYAYLAPALINRDPSGLEPADLATLETVWASIPGWDVVGIGDPYFGRPSTPSAGPPGDVAEYVLLREATP